MPKFVMSDGRNVGESYTPSCALNAQIQEKFNVGNSHNYRYFLQKNATQVMSHLAECENQANCAFCPVCKQALELKGGKM